MKKPDRWAGEAVMVEGQGLRREDGILVYQAVVLLLGLAFLLAAAASAWVKYATPTPATTQSNVASINRDDDAALVAQGWLTAKEAAAAIKAGATSATLRESEAAGLVNDCVPGGAANGSRYRTWICGWYGLSGGLHSRASIQWGNNAAGTGESIIDFGRTG